MGCLLVRSMVCSDHECAVSFIGSKSDWLYWNSYPFPNLKLIQDTELQPVSDWGPRLGPGMWVLARWTYGRIWKVTTRKNLVPISNELIFRNEIEVLLLNKIEIGFVFYLKGLLWWALQKAKWYYCINAFIFLFSFRCLSFMHSFVFWDEKVMHCFKCVADLFPQNDRCYYDVSFSNR